MEPEAFFALIASIAPLCPAALVDLVGFSFANAATTPENLVWLSANIRSVGAWTTSGRSEARCLDTRRLADIVEARAAELLAASALAEAAQ
jgi:hypothetical protein